MSRGISKEKTGMTVRFSIRLPKEQHAWLKARSECTFDEKGQRISMNRILSEALEEYMMGK